MTTRTKIARRLFVSPRLSPSSLNPLLPDLNFLKDRMTVEERVAELEKKLNMRDKRLDKV